MYVFVCCPIPSLYKYVLYVCMYVCMYVLCVRMYVLYVSCLCDSTSTGIETTYEMKTWLAELDYSKRKKFLFFKDMGPDGK